MSVGYTSMATVRVILFKQSLYGRSNTTLQTIYPPEPPLRCEVQSTSSRANAGLAIQDKVTIHRQFVKRTWKASKRNMKRIQYPVFSLRRLPNIDEHGCNIRSKELNGFRHGM